MPTRRSATAAARPPIPPPMISARGRRGAGLPRFAAAGWPCRGRRAGGRVLLGLLSFMLVEHRLGRGVALGAELGPVVSAPLERGLPCPVQLREMRHHEARIEFIGALCR